MCYHTNPLQARVSVLVPQYGNVDCLILTIVSESRKRREQQIFIVKIWRVSVSGKFCPQQPEPLHLFRSVIFSSPLLTSDCGPRTFGYGLRKASSGDFWAMRTPTKRRYGSDVACHNACRVCFLLRIRMRHFAVKDLVRPAMCSTPPRAYRPRVSCGDCCRLRKRATCLPRGFHIIAILR